MRGLDAAVRRMREGTRAELLLPPPWSYTQLRRQPEPTSESGIALLSAMLSGDGAAGSDGGGGAVWMDVQLEAVLALPPNSLAAPGHALSPRLLRGLLTLNPDCTWTLNIPARLPPAKK